MNNYITFKIKFLLFPFKLTLFLHNKKRLLQTVLVYNSLVNYVI